MTDHERAQYGIARAKHVAFDAVSALWRKRRTEGMKQLDIARLAEQSPSTVSRNLSGPGNWTLQTLGLYVEALNGELEITVHAMEDPPETPTNYDAYAAYATLTVMGHQRVKSRRPLISDNATFSVSTTS